MAAAFGRFDEPHAWLLRSLVEYGWTDCTRTQGHYPPGAIGGLNLARLLQNDGRDGFVVEIPATPTVLWCSKTAPTPLRCR